MPRPAPRVLGCLFRFLLALVAFSSSTVICDVAAGFSPAAIALKGGAAPEPLRAQFGGAQGALSADQSAYEQAFELLANGHAAEALAEADAALKKYPKSSELHNVRGMAADQVGRTREAEASFRKVIELSPRSSVGYNNLAALLVRLGRIREGERLFRTALERDPHSSAALLGLGETLAALQNYVEAASYLRQGWRLSPSDFQTAYEYARVLRELRRPTE
ncbi:MAG: hypothetical protein DMG24_17805, partial [Acidobacteria bacterium]